MPRYSAKSDQIWQIADTENRGLLTPSGFGVVLRLIGHAQAGRQPSPEIATQREFTLYRTECHILTSPTRNSRSSSKI